MRVSPSVDFLQSRFMDQFSPTTFTIPSIIQNCFVRRAFQPESCVTVVKESEYICNYDYTRKGIKYYGTRVKEN